MAGGTVVPSEEGLARLEQGAALLRKVPAENFNILAWERNSAHSKFTADNVGACGFAGCAMGWFANAKLFDGLEIVKTNHRVMVKYDFKYDYDAAVKLFDISIDAALYLFSPEAYATEAGSSDPSDLRQLPPAAVARRIEQFVAHVKKEGAEPSAVGVS